MLLCGGPRSKTASGCRKGSYVFFRVILDVQSCNQQAMTTTATTSASNAIAFESELRDDACSSPSAISIEVSGFVYFEQLLASIDLEPSDDANRSSFEETSDDDTFSSSSIDEYSSVIKSIEHLRVGHHVDEGKLRRKTISSPSSRANESHPITTRIVYSFSKTEEGAKEGAKEGDLAAGLNRRGGRRQGSFARQLSARTA